jgi:hypothetical protein
MPNRLAKRHRIALALLAGGWVVSLAVFFLAKPAESNLPTEYTDVDKGYVYQAERIGGRSAVVAEELREGFSSLFQGPRLGLTLGVLTVLVVLGYLAFADDES